jgi:transposase
MFIREKKFKDRARSYLQIVENQRVDGQIHQKVILSLGCLQTLQKSGDLKKLASSLLKFCESDFCETKDIKEQARVNWGGPKIVHRLWQLFDFDAIFKLCLKNRDVQFDVARTVKLMLTDRLLCPCSKKKTYDKQGKYALSDNIDLHHLYRSLDFLAVSKEQIEQKLFEKNTSLFDMLIDVVFYDVTTLYFESERADLIRNFGYSKDKKHDEVQIVLGLLVDIEGRPIGYDVFPGNFYEGQTLPLAIDKLKKRFNIDKIIIVADRGMMSSNNIEYLQGSGYEYIISARLRKLPAKIQTEIRNLDEYLPAPPHNDDEYCPINKYRVYVPENVFGAVISCLMLERPAQETYDEIRKITKNVHDGHLVKRLRDFRKQPYTKETREKLLKSIEHYCSQRLILTWSEKRAKRDQAKRELLVARAEELLRTPAENLAQKGPKRYLKTEAKQLTLDHKKIENDRQWDGFYGIYTNNKQLDWSTILRHYRGLWRVEESFRIFKTHLETRPIFHWTESRIRGHLMLCFIAFLFERTIETTLRTRKVTFSPDKIRCAIDQMQMSLLEINGSQLYMRANVDQLGMDILNAFKIQVPSQMFPAEGFEI